jgi:hypothetical protein
MTGVACPWCEAVIPTALLQAEPWDEDRFDLAGLPVRLDPTDLKAHLLTHEATFRAAFEGST